MNSKRHTWIAMTVVLIFGVVLFYVGTDGFHAFTAESARTYELIKDKPEFPAVTLEDSSEESYTFNELANGKYVFITFMYTSCTDVCPILEKNMGEVYDLIPEKYIGEDILFLSISFDPERDTPKTLANYENAFDSDGSTWRMVRVNDQEELDNMLKQLGVIVIPDGNGNFTHNSAFYLIGREGHLLEVMDFTQIGDAADKVTDILNKEWVNSQ
ncbi:SCO family protein [Lentibacillus sp. N15]|uniref:SCO family protein n=1 Tax=Lentibacillus songyuanensis TaxID=3136161 RepID=UPI0031BA9493